MPMYQSSAQQRAALPLAIGGSAALAGAYASALSDGFHWGHALAVAGTAIALRGVATLALSSAENPGVLRRSVLLGELSALEGYETPGCRRAAFLGDVRDRLLAYRPIVDAEDYASAVDAAAARVSPRESPLYASLVAQAVDLAGTLGAPEAEAASLALLKA